MLALVLAAVATGACATWGGFAEPHPGEVRDRPTVKVGEAAAKLHLSRPASAKRAVLLLHVTGDMGWFGLDRLFFDAMAARGFTLAGVSARALRGDLGSPGPRATPARLAADYLALIQAAEARLELPPGTPVVLTGLSRGASLAVVASSQPELDRRIAGILAMGLIAEEATVHPAVPPYALLGRIDSPLVVVQSTVDRHLAAADARRLFGPDTARRKLVAIDASGHTFGGRHEELFRQAEAAIGWILQPRASGGS